MSDTNKVDAETQLLQQRDSGQITHEEAIK
jgi:hypothetical protein